MYGALSLLTFGGLLWLLAHRWRDFPNAALTFPSVALWFAWRSLQNYFSFVGVFALIGDETVVADAESTDATPQPAAVTAVASPSTAP